jgi:hypothetical protein
MQGAIFIFFCFDCKNKIFFVVSRNNNLNIDTLDETTLLKQLKHPVQKYGCQKWGGVLRCQRNMINFNLIKVVVLDVFFTPDGSELAWDGVHFT